MLTKIAKIIKNILEQAWMKIHGRLKTKVTWKNKFRKNRQKSFRGFDSKLHDFGPNRPVSIWHVMNGLSRSFDVLPTQYSFPWYLIKHFYHIVTTLNFYQTVTTTLPHLDLTFTTPAPFYTRHSDFDKGHVRSLEVCWVLPKFKF